MVVSKMAMITEKHCMAASPICGTQEVVAEELTVTSKPISPIIRTARIHRWRLVLDVRGKNIKPLQLPIIIMWVNFLFCGLLFCLFVYLATFFLFIDIRVVSSTKSILVPQNLRINSPPTSISPFNENKNEVFHGTWYETSSIGVPKCIDYFNVSLIITDER